MRVVLALMCVVWSSAVFADLDSSEEKWVKNCVDGLKSKRTLVRKSAGKALAALGVSALPLVVKQSRHLKSDSFWKRLERSLIAMGPRKVAKLLKQIKDQWPRESRERLEAIVETLGSEDDGDDPDVAKKVKKLLEKYNGASSYSTNDSATRKIIALGRAAVPELLRILEQVESNSAFSMENFLQSTASEALAALVTKEDHEVLAELLATGQLKVAKCLSRIPGPETLDALLVPIKKGFVNHELLRALKRYRKDKKTTDALIKFLDKFGQVADWSVGRVAEFLGDSGAFDALPTLERLLEVDGNRGFRTSLGKGLVSLGSEEGIAVLMEVFEDDDQFAGGARHSAGEALNRIVGERIYVGSFGPDKNRGNFDEAEERFRDWFDENEDRLVYDRKTRRWSLKE